jgi:hypothetical protein
VRVSVCRLSWLCVLSGTSGNYNYNDSFSESIWKSIYLADNASHPTQHYEVRTPPSVRSDRGGVQVGDGHGQSEGCCAGRTGSAAVFCMCCMCCTEEKLSTSFTAPLPLIILPPLPSGDPAARYGLHQLRPPVHLRAIHCICWDIRRKGAYSTCR